MEIIKSRCLAWERIGLDKGYKIQKDPEKRLVRGRVQQKPMKSQGRGKFERKPTFSQTQSLVWVAVLSLFFPLVHSLFIGAMWARQLYSSK